MKLHALSLALGALLVLSSCSIQNNTHVQRSRMDNYSKLYAERPRTILLMPVVNKGGGAQLDQPLLQASVRALSEQGYYVISPRVVSALVGVGGLEVYRTMEPHWSSSALMPPSIRPSSTGSRIEAKGRRGLTLATSYVRSDRVRPSSIAASAE